MNDWTAAVERRLSRAADLWPRRAGRLEWDEWVDLDLRAVEKVEGGGPLHDDEPFAWSLPFARRNLGQTTLKWVREGRAATPRAAGRAIVGGADDTVPASLREWLSQGSALTRSVAAAEAASYAERRLPTLHSPEVDIAEGRSRWRHDLPGSLLRLSGRIDAYHAGSRLGLVWIDRDPDADHERPAAAWACLVARMAGVTLRAVVCRNLRSGQRAEVDVASDEVWCVVERAEAALAQVAERRSESAETCENAGE